jgi:hypothetical protein
MFDDKQKIMERVASLPKSGTSPSGRYWCVTCKMLFTLDRPVCPYMPKMCINSPIPVELMPVESAITLEKFGLFYPKIPQKLLAHLADTDDAVDARALVDAYLSFLADWGMRPADEPLQALKSFIILLSGCETAQRVSESQITFVVTDADRVWREDRLLPLLDATLPLLAAEVGVTQQIRLDAMVLMGERPSGRYFCPMCRKFFEFSTQRPTVTCPLMAQKCMATPAAVSEAKFTLADLVHVYQVTPDFQARLAAALPARSDARARLTEILRDDWGLEPDDESLGSLAGLLGV